MKKRTILWIVLILSVMVLSACTGNETANQPEVPASEGDPVEDQAVDGSYPAPETAGDAASAPTQAPEYQLPASAYPVTEEDTNLLINTWVLSSYAENQVAGAVMDKTLTFNNDGSYEIITDGEAVSGTWETQLNAYQALLFLNDGTGQTTTYTIIDLEEDMLQLQYWQEDIEINEQYQPAS